MDDQRFINKNVVIHHPQESADETTTAAADVDEPLPPAYEYPQIDFYSGWNNSGFALFFWLHTITVIIVGSVLGIPVVLDFIKQNVINKQNWTSSNPNIKIFFYSLGSAAATGSLMSFAIFFLLQQCAGQVIKCSLIMMIVIEILVITFLAYMRLWFSCITPGIILLVTLLYFSSIRKRISFAEVHLKVGCAIIRSHPSIILVALMMLVVKFLWLVFWCLMILGILNTTNIPLFNRNINTLTTSDVTSPRTYVVNNPTSTVFDRIAYMINKKTNKTNDVSYRHDTQTKSSSEPQSSSARYVTTIIIFSLLLSWYWGTITFANVVHFITACTVGHWWFTDAAGEQYTLGTSIKRAFTTDFGTICLGSLLQAFVKALRSCANSKKGNSCCAWCADCILGMIERAIGYINEWAFIFAALTGQSFIEASKSFVQLFQKRGWTMILNDVIVDNSLKLVNIVSGLVSTVVGGLIAYMLVWDSSKQASYTIFIISIISFLIGVFFNVIMATMMTSCVHTIFACFALNPAALGATHPNHLQSLTNAWHTFYPEEYAASGYQKYPPDAAKVESYV